MTMVKMMSSTSIHYVMLAGILFIFSYRFYHENVIMKEKKRGVKSVYQS
ncbi:hypothetical protein EVA_10758 [gut metagenome]|uniref:Uncharacterized protein n=1 Tax=gut metagenome TaxID=749906 RepID=J9CM17_9ZZZZ